MARMAVVVVACGRTRLQVSALPPHSGGDPHAHHRRPRPRLPTVRLPRHPPPPARRTLPPTAHRHSPRDVDLRSRHPHPTPPPDHHPARRLHQSRGCRGRTTDVPGGGGGRIQRRSEPDRRRLPPHLADGEGAGAQADDHGPLPRLRAQRSRPRLRQPQAGRPPAPAHQRIRDPGARRRPRPHHPLPVPGHPVQRAGGRGPPAPPRPQPRQPTGPAPTARAGTPDLDRARGSPVPAALPRSRPGHGRPLRVPHRHRPAQGRGPRPALGRRPPDGTHPLRALHTLRDRQQPTRHHPTQDPLQQELGGHLTPRRRRPPPPRPLRHPHSQQPTRALQRTGLLPTRRPATAAQHRSEPAPAPVRRSGCPPGDRSRPAPPGRHPHHHRRRAAHRGLQDPAPLHPVHHGQHLQPPHPASRPRSRRHHRAHPRTGRADNRPAGPVEATAITTRPHPTPSRSPQPAPLPRPIRLPNHREPARTRPATTLRPPALQERKKPPSRKRENGLRPASKLVGTTGFEPATP